MDKEEILKKVEKTEELEAFEDRCMNAGVCPHCGECCDKWELHCMRMCKKCWEMECENKRLSNEKIDLPPGFFNLLCECTDGLLKLGCCALLVFAAVVVLTVVGFSLTSLL